MSVFAFTLTIDQYLEDIDAINSFYSKVDDASIAGSEGKTFIHFDREANSLDDALRSAVADVQKDGWTVQEIAVDPHCVQTTSSI